MGRKRRERINAEFAESAEDTEKRRKQRIQERAAGRRPLCTAPASEGRRHKKSKVREKRDG